MRKFTKTEQQFLEQVLETLLENVSLPSEVTTEAIATAIKQTVQRNNTLALFAKTGLLEKPDGTYEYLPQQAKELRTVITHKVYLRLTNNNVKDHAQAHAK